MKLNHSLAEYATQGGTGTGAEMLADLDEDELHANHVEWNYWQRLGQIEPPDEWRTWLMMAGRGFGKTRAGAEWVRALVAAIGGDARIALVGATESDARSVMVEGDSGLLAVTPEAERPMWETTRGRLVWPNGAHGYVYSAESPERLRGPEFHGAWCDEVAAWPGELAWDNLQLALRKGERPRVVATTTPRATGFMRRLVAAPQTVVTHGRTADNPVLSKRFVAAMLEEHGGTRLGRQELDGELIVDLPGALWTRALIEAARVPARPPVVRVVIGVDPPAGSKTGNGDACGIVVAGLGVDGLAYVIEDASVASGNPAIWAAAVAAAAARHKVDQVIAEANMGGKMVESVLLAADAELPIKLVHASHGKVRRAEPVAHLYHRARVRHVGSFPALEDELCGLMTGGGYEGPGRSPDRADACVWALTALMLGRRSVPQVRAL